ncbi:TIM barrel protein [Verrucomicrobia bacterium]|jgi:hydroxypyruvate isomerase|nr:TIM barrel protein [Verrucomicrobiota bacterium]
MKFTRRQFIRSAALAGAGCLVSSGMPSQLSAQMSRSHMNPEYKARGGPVRHSVMGWCFNPMPTSDLIRQGKAMGLEGIEGISQSSYKEAMDAGLKISLVSGGHGFREGPCNPKFHDKVVQGLRRSIETASDIGAKNVITFTGMRYEGMDDEAAAQRCVETWKEVLPLAESKGITLVLEHLNSRDDSHPMKGHPGYFGDDVDFCVDMIRQIGSNHFKLLFDIYHVSVMNGDVIRRIRRYHPMIGHYHTAGNPGRGELDQTQEINYPAVIHEILKTGYQGFLAHEFIPTWDDPMTSLRHGIQVCDLDA